jgi:alkylhydroperoxidase family enzyme
MDTFLPPIECPKGLMMKVVYAMARRRFGQVLTPLKVHLARMPLAFGMWVGKVSQLDKRVTLPEELVLLVRQQVAQINVCEFCIDISRWSAAQKSHSLAKLDALDAYQTSPLFSLAERAALDYATRLTRDKRVAPEVFHRLAEQFSDREICEIVWLVASEHVYNISNIGLNIHSDGLCGVLEPTADAGRAAGMTARS